MTHIALASRRSGSAHQGRAVPAAVIYLRGILMPEIIGGRRWAVTAALSAVVVLGHGPHLRLPGTPDAYHLPPRLRGCAGNVQLESATRVIGPAGGTIRFG